jgi:hypothetical protein
MPLPEPAGGLGAVAAETSGLVCGCAPKRLFHAGQAGGSAIPGQLLAA